MCVCQGILYVGNIEKDCNVCYVSILLTYAHKVPEQQHISVVEHEQRFVTILAAIYSLADNSE